MKKEHSHLMGNKEGDIWKEMNVPVMEWMMRRSRGSRDRVYTNIAKIMSTVPGAAEEKAYGQFLMADMLREEAEEESETMDRFELKALVEVVKGMGLEPIVKKKLINEVVKADKQLQLVYQMEQEKQPEVEKKKEYRGKGE